jgi:cell division protein FtsW (lipid II flippase)
MSAIVVALPLFAFHWHKASNKSRAEMDWESRKTYTMAVLIISTVIMLVVGIWLVYNGFNAILGVADSYMKQQLAYALPYAVTAVGVWLWHMKIWQGREMVIQNKTETGNV